jgi:hypothetical protein
LRAAGTVPEGSTQSSLAMITVFIVSPLSSGWSCWAMKPGTTTFPANVSSTVVGWPPAAACSSSTVPTARMRSPRIATAVAVGFAGSRVTISFAR